MSKYLTGVEHHHLELRKTITQFEANNQAVFGSLHTAINQTPFSEHLKNIKMPYVWGTSMEIMAAASFFQLDVYVATDSYRPGVPTWLLYTPKPLSILTNPYLSAQLRGNIKIKKRWIELTYVSHCHFDSIRPLEGSQISPPKLNEDSPQRVQVIV